MKFRLTLHLVPVADRKGEMGDWSDTIKEALEQIPDVHKVEVEPEHIRGSGDQ